MNKYILIAGPRQKSLNLTTFTYENFINIVDKELKEENTYNIVIVHGGATGIDSMADQYAKDNRLNYKVYLPQYNNYVPRVAPIIRNIEMAKDCHYGIIFSGLKTRGTKNMIENLQKEKKPHTIYDLNFYT